MGMPPHIQAHFAQAHITRAVETVGAIHDKLVSESKETNLMYERFYNNLALFSGGTIVLSVTFLGYLKSTTKSIERQSALVDCWIILIVCLACSLFWNFFHTHYAIYSRNRELSEAEKKRYETEIDEIAQVGAANINTFAQIEEYRRPRRDAVEILRKKVKYYERREKIYLFVWQWGGRLARVSFLLGIASLVYFAISNTH